MRWLTHVRVVTLHGDRCVVTSVHEGYDDAMAVAVKKLDVQLGDLVEIGGRRYDVVPDRQGGVALEPAITRTVADIHREHGGRPVTQAEFDELFGDLPPYGEG
jgi:hypothetical protein